MTDPAQGPWTVLKLIDWTKDYFTRREIADPRLAAEILLASVLDCPRIQLYTRFDHQPAPDQLAAFRLLVKKAGEHEPIAYLVGEKEFYSLPFKVTPDVLVPRPETEILVSEAIRHLKATEGPATMWDACTGSGCVAVATARHVPGLALLATDICDEALKVAGENARTNGVAERIRLRRADLLALPQDCSDLAAFDAITANPPYVADSAEVAPDVAREPKAALRAGPDGLGCIRRIITEAPSLLKEAGALILEFGYDQADSVRDLLVQTGAFAEPRILRDHQSIERACVAVRK